MALQLGPDHPLFDVPTGPQHKAFGESLVAARVNRAYSQQHLADEVGVSRDLLRAWEHGYKLPSAHHLHALVRILRLRWDGGILVNDPILGSGVPVVKLVAARPDSRIAECAFDPRHSFSSVEAPSSEHVGPSYCSPACTSAAVRRDRRRAARLAGGIGR